MVSVGTFLRAEIFIAQETTSNLLEEPQGSMEPWLGNSAITYEKLIEIDFFVIFVDDLFYFQVVVKAEDFFTFMHSMHEGKNVSVCSSPCSPLTLDSPIKTVSVDGGISPAEPLYSLGWGKVLEEPSNYSH